MVLQTLWRTGDVPARTIHGDAKLNNVLLDARTEDALCVIDFDTVSAGLLLHDVSDCVRELLSGTAGRRGSLAEDDLAAFGALLGGFVRGVGAGLSVVERDHVIDAVVSIALELAARFLTDFLSGDTYFHTTRDWENLERTRQHILLVKLVETQRRRLEAVVRAACADL